MIEVQTAAKDVTLLRLRHGKANALDLELVTELTEGVRTMERESRSALILTGTGTIFSAGVDLRRLVDGGADYATQFVPAVHEMFRTLFRFPRPAVAAINGHAIAGGCILACACDWRIVPDGEAKIGLPETNVGVPFPVAALEIMRFVLGDHRLGQMLFSGELFAGRSALTAGLADEVSDGDEILDRAMLAVERLFRVPPDTFALTKRQVRQITIDRIDSEFQRIGDEIVKTWRHPATLSAVKDYVTQTLSRSRQ